MELVLALRTGTVRIRAALLEPFGPEGFELQQRSRGAFKLDAGVFSLVFVTFIREDATQGLSAPPLNWRKELWCQKSKLTKTAHEERDWECTPEPY